MSAGQVGEMEAFIQAPRELSSGFPNIMSGLLPTPLGKTKNLVCKARDLQHETFQRCKSTCPVSLLLLSGRCLGSGQERSVPNNHPRPFCGREGISALRMRLRKDKSSESALPTLSHLPQSGGAHRTFLSEHLDISKVKKELFTPWSLM